MKKFSFFVLVLAFSNIVPALFAEPCALVNRPCDIRFIDLKEIAKFLEEDLDLGKGITEVIGREIIDRKFRKAGIPDPAKQELSYSIVAREGTADSLNLCFILKGNVRIDSFLEFAEKRYTRYFETLKAQKIIDSKKVPYDIKINGRPSRVFPFAFRESEAVITWFEEYTIISTIPKGDHSLISETIGVLEGQAPLSQNQPDKVSFKCSFVPIPQERSEIRNFENRYEGFVAKTRKRFKKIFNNSGYQNEKAMAKLEQDLKEALANIQEFTYRISAGKKDDGYAYRLNLRFQCGSDGEAVRMKNLLLSWLASTSSKTLSEQDMVSFKANKVYTNSKTCIYDIELGSSKDEQYQFSSMVLSLMLQDRRFNSIFKS